MVGSGYIMNNIQLSRAAQISYRYLIHFNKSEVFPVVKLFLL